MTAMLLVLAGCTDIYFDLPDRVDSDSDGPGLVDSVDSGDTDTDTDTDTFVPAVCAAASWSWGGTNTSTTADASFVGPELQHPTSNQIVIPVAPGDMDGDGVIDVVITVGSHPDHTAVYFLVGGITRAAGQPLEGRPSLLHAQFNASVGDVDGDGLADVALAPEAASYDKQWLMRGRTGAWPVDGDPDRYADALITYPQAPDVNFFTLAPFGDHDGDGLDDWLLFAAGVDDKEAHVIRGVDAVGEIEIPTADRMWVNSEQDEPLFLPVTGDLDGDRRVDIVARSQDWSTFYFLLAASSGTAHDEGFADVAAATLRHPRGFHDPAVLADLNGDGVAEFAIALLNTNVLADRGVYLFFGGSRWSGSLTTADADVHVGAGDFVQSPTWLGDLNGDGLPELGVIHDPSDGRASATNAYIYLGRPVWPARLTLADADVRIRADSVSGDSLQLPKDGMRGDIDGDGLGDLILRIPDEGTDSAGRISVYLGRSAWPAELGAADADVTFAGDESQQVMGAALVVADVDADGCDDLLNGSVYPPIGVQGELFVHFGQNAP